MELNDGAMIPTKTLIRTAGTRAHVLTAGLPCKNDRGRLHVNEFMELEGRPGVWHWATALPFPI
jgi:NADH dehydrogenase FAD-containing subunit